MFARFKKLAPDERGAATVDFTVMTAAVIGLGLATIVAVSGGVDDLSGYVGVQLEDMIDSAAPDYSTVGLLHKNHDESWRQVLQERLKTFNDNRLTRVYDNAYVLATSVDSTLNQRRNGVDRLGVIETEMYSRGMTIPEGNTSFEDLYDELLALG
jgi:Flp pilus assembly pilin Flp